MAALAAHLMRVGYKLINRPQIRVSVRHPFGRGGLFRHAGDGAVFQARNRHLRRHRPGAGVVPAKTSTPTLAEYTFNESGHLAELPDKAQRLHPQISIIHVEGELFFGAADLFQNQVRRQAEDENIRVFILRMKNARHLDASTVMALEALHDYLRKTDRHLIISGCTADVYRVLRNSGLLKQIGEENLFPIEANPTLSTRKALQRAQELLPGKSEIRLFYPVNLADDADAKARPNDYDI